MTGPVVEAVLVLGGIDGNLLVGAGGRTDAGTVEVFETVMVECWKGYPDVGRSRTRVLALYHLTGRLWSSHQR